jgi:hypothetical protein
MVDAKHNAIILQDITYSQTSTPVASLFYVHDSCSRQLVSLHLCPALTSESAQRPDGRMQAIAIHFEVDSDS